MKNWYPVLDMETCEECGKCVEKCSTGVFDKSSPRTPVIVYPDGCKDGCHGCGNLCPTGSITYFGENTGWTSPNKKSRNIMTREEQIRELVKQRYNDLAMLDKASVSCCCNPMTPAAPSKKVFTLMSENYSKLKGYNKDADLGLGCGLPTQYARIQKGDTVVDLGSGAGNDCFIAREETGAEGRVIGIDFAPQMIARARANAAKRGFTNIEFLEGDIENMPLPDMTANVVVSNCVLNLLPSKDKIFKEIYRVLKPGGHFCISDVVLDGVFPKEFTDNAAMYAGCIASAIQRADYLGEVEKAGFAGIKVERTKTITIPDEVLQEHLDEATIEKYRAGNVGIYSITVTGRRSGM